MHGKNMAGLKGSANMLTSASGFDIALQRLQGPGHADSTEKPCQHLHLSHFHEAQESPIGPSTCKTSRHVVGAAMDWEDGPSVKAGDTRQMNGAAAAMYVPASRPSTPGLSLSVTQAAVSSAKMKTRPWPAELLAREQP